MKTSLFNFIIYLSAISLSSAGRPQVPVRDTDGNILRSGTNYYILPAVRGSGGGITLTPGIYESCPNDVAQEKNELNKGLPWSFVPGFTSEHGIIYESADVNVKFSGPGKCVPTPVWRFEYNRDWERIVSSHGIVGNPGKESIRNWFKIEKYDNDYKMVYCPSVCNVCDPYCADIGSKVAKDGHRTLVLNNKPLKVKFKKA